jgi:acetyltransferase (GNAT) family protein
VQVRSLDRRHNRAMLDILRQAPIEAGGLSICFDRQPDIFALADLKYAPAVWRGFFEDGALAGFTLAGYHQAYVNRAATPVMHITDCYIRPESRGRGYLKAALAYFSNEGADRAKLGYAVVMKGNRGAEAQLGDRFAATPCALRSRIIGELEARSLLLAFPRRKQPHLPVRRARLDDIEDIVSLLRAEHEPRLFGLVTDRDAFAAQVKHRPGLSIDDYYVFEKTGKLAGVCAAWDTGVFKQNRIMRYGLGLTLVRAGSLVAAKLSGAPSLPRPGEAFRDVFLTDWAVRDRSTEVMNALIEHIYHEYRSRRYHTLIFGSCSQDPMLGAADGFRATKLVSHIALMSLEEKWLREGAVDTRLPFIDLALL